jgi:hypothetical protein
MTTQQVKEQELRQRILFFTVGDFIPEMPITGKLQFLMG